MQKIGLNMMHQIVYAQIDYTWDQHTLQCFTTNQLEEGVTQLIFGPAWNDKVCWYQVGCRHEIAWVLDGCGKGGLWQRNQQDYWLPCAGELWTASEISDHESSGIACRLLYPWTTWSHHRQCQQHTHYYTVWWWRVVGSQVQEGLRVTIHRAIVNTAPYSA